MTARLGLLLLATASTVMLGFTFLRLPGNSLFWSSLQNSGHGIVFAALGAVFLAVVHRQLKKTMPTALAISSVTLFLLGTSIELAQYATGRGAALNDMVMNSVGIVSGVCLYGAVHYFKRSNTSSIRAIALLVLGTAAMAWCIRWPVAYQIAGAHRPSLPVLADFENVGAQLFVSGTGSTQTIRIHEEWSENLTHSVKVNFQQSQWPNIAFREPIENWGQYSSLSFSGYNPHDAEITIRVRIDERRPSSSEINHMTVRQVIPPGEFTVVLGFDVFAADAARQGQLHSMNFMQMTGFMVFLLGADVEAQGEIVLYFDEFRLQ